MKALQLWDNLLRRFPALKVYAANPVVMRDLRAQMRGARAYWYIGGYLFLLGLLAVAGYAQATGQSLHPAYWSERGRNIVDAQSNLQSFYLLIYGTLALLVTLIAPAMTAASVVGERQRQSFDLLVTTPLSANQLLVGKLVSSVAFLGLLLVLSLPASALCILLGGATPGDVLRVYFLLAVDGVVLSAIGLYFSCAVRVPLLATVWTYAAVAGFCLVSASGYIGMVENPTGLPLNPIVSVFWLNPLAAIAPVMNGEGTGGLLLLRLAVFLGIASLLVRLLLAAATYRLGLFGAQSGVTLRRLSLVLTAIAVTFLSHAIGGTAFAGKEIKGILIWLPTYGILILAILLVTLPFLPGLFVPSPAEDAPPGMTPDTASDPSRHRIFAVRRLFYPEHSGALPWYGAFVLTVVLSLLAGILPYPALWVYAAPMVAAGGVYLLGVGIVCWSLSRLAGTFVPELSPARAAAFGLYIAVLGLPTLLFSLQWGDWHTHPLIPLWLLSPLLYGNDPLRLMEAMLRSGLVAGAAGVLLSLFTARSRNREAYAVPTAAPR
jgi:ABC-type transport system involved in multi-copper enzyme maturation permease subunit